VTPSRKLPPFSYIPFRRTATRSLSAVDVARRAPVAVAAEMQRQFLQRHECGFLRDAIDDTATTAAAEHRGIRTFDRRSLEAVGFNGDAVIFQMRARA
jgi:hypothetical protein